MKHLGISVVKYTPFGVLLTILLIINIILLRNASIDQKGFEAERQYLNLQLKSLETQIDILSQDIILMAQSGFLSINPETLVTDSTFREKRLISIVESPKVVLRYPALSCEPCNDSLFFYFNASIAKYNFKNYIILTNYQSIRELGIFERKNQFSGNVYNLNNPLIRVDSLNIPYIFYLDNSFYVKSLFIPIKYKPELLVEYLDFLIHNFFEKTE